ncbi:MAG: Smr/MutS family protein [Xanthobacteraceae bacterium]
MSAGRGPRGLAPEDRVLWDEIKKSIKPLRARGSEAAAAEPVAEPAPARKQPPKPDPTPPPPLKAPPQLTKLDRRTRQRVARGRAEIEARLDLHGMTLERARARLATFLASAQARGAGLALVITGKGSADRREGERGALRREVPHWLSLPEFRTLVIGFEEAARGHGGAGALYVRIRRARN